MGKIVARQVVAAKFDRRIFGSLAKGIGRYQQPSQRVLHQADHLPQKLSFSPNCRTRMEARRFRISPTRGASGITELGETNPILLG